MKNILCGFLLCVSSFVWAQSGNPGNAACMLQSTSHVDSLLNPVSGSDENFLRSGAAVPNILFVLDTSSSMADFPFPSWGKTIGGGCNVAGVNSLGYDPTQTYPRMWLDLTTPSPWFETNMYYDWAHKNATFGNSFEMGLERQGAHFYNTNPAHHGAVARYDKYPDDPTYFHSTAGVPDVHRSPDPVTACSQRGVTNSAACQACLQTNGYYTVYDSVLDVTSVIAYGNFLNSYSPRIHSAVNAISQVVRQNPNARYGLIAFSGAADQIDNGTLLEWPGEYHVGAPIPNGTNGFTERTTLIEPFGPSCALAMSAPDRDVHRIELLNRLTTMLSLVGATPLSQNLYAAGYYFRSAGMDPFAGRPGYGPSVQWSGLDETAANKSSCFSCSFNAIILLTDGQPSEVGIDPPAFMTQPSPDVPKGPSPNEAAYGASVAGLNGPGPQAWTGATADGGTNNGQNISQIHRIASWLAHNDIRLDYPDTQTVSTYTVAFALGNQNALDLLNSTAQLGAGKAFRANNTSQLITALTAILSDINTKSASFATASTTGFQTSQLQAGVLFPFTRPAGGSLPWRGELWRFAQYNEYVQNNDLNGNGNINDVLLVDADADIIQQTGGGFIKVKNGANARPYWEAGSVLQNVVLSNRKVYTAIDTNGDGVVTASDGLTAFDAAHWTTLKDYFGVLGTQQCPYWDPTTSTDPDSGLTVPPHYDSGGILRRLGLTIPQAATLMGLPVPDLTGNPIPADSDIEELCSKVIIAYIRGQNLGGEAPLSADGGTIVPDRTAVRPSILGDIFHSSPIVVEAPLEKTFCELGLNGQCVPSLFSLKLGPTGTPLQGGYNVTRCGNSLTLDAYDAFVEDQRIRDRVVLVGANDGMLHAFLDSKYVPDPLGTCINGIPKFSYDPTNANAGQELWAFIPPDLLSRIPDLFNGHTYLVDGDIMVRDVWADASGVVVPADNLKQKDEFHTMAIFAEGRGGTHYFALELQYDVKGAPLPPAPRWIYPQPNNPIAPKFGKTLFTLSAKPPPIGPVLLEDHSPVGITRYGQGTKEQWVTMLSGGWSPGNEKGRGVYMVDVWNGNTLWTYDYAPVAVGSVDEPRRNLTHSVVAPVAMVDYGQNGDPHADGYFDGAVFGDLRGQLWMARFFTPGHVNPVTGLVTNWSAARTFEMGKDPNGLVTGMQPFFSMPSLVLQPSTGMLRAYFGSGDQYSLLDTATSGCRFDNTLQCGRLQCDTLNTSTITSYFGLQYADATNHFQTGKLIPPAVGSSTDPTGLMASNACGPVSTDMVINSISKESVNSCPVITGPNANYGDLRNNTVRCGRDANGYYNCHLDETVATNTSDLNIPTSVLQPTLGINRFFGVRIYGGNDGLRVFDETDTNPLSVTAPLLYDASRLTDTQLLDVTPITCTALGCSCATGFPACNPNGAATTDNGWYYNYTGDSEKTSSGSLVVLGGVFWNGTLPTGASVPCNTTPVDTRFYEADYISGSPRLNPDSSNVAVLYNRLTDRPSVVVPSSPGLMTSVNSQTGQVVTSFSMEPGGTQQALNGTEDLVQSLYQLPVDRAVARCRYQSDAGVSVCDGLTY